MKSPAARVALNGLLFALAITLSVLEGMVPIPIGIPGVRLGLSNIVVMYCVFLCGPRQAYLLGTLKALFALLTRGMVAGLLSLSGGILSITVMLLLRKLFPKSIAPVSIGGGVAHNLGQIACAVWLYGEGGRILWRWLPVLAAVGVLVGTLTAVLLRAVLPALEKLGGTPGQPIR